MKADYALNYLSEFHRILKPGAILYFQLPEPQTKSIWKRIQHIKVIEFLLFPILWPIEYLITPFFIKTFPNLKLALPKSPKMQMHGVPHEMVKSHIKHLGMTLLATWPDNKCGPKYSSFTYVCKKKNA